MASTIQSPVFQSMAVGISSLLLTTGINRIYSSEDDRTVDIFGKFIATTFVMDHFILKGVELAGKIFTLPRTTVILAIIAGNCAYVVLRLFFSGKSKSENASTSKINAPSEIQTNVVVNNNNAVKQITCSIVPIKGFMEDVTETNLIMGEVITVINQKLDELQKRNSGFKEFNKANSRFSFDPNNKNIQVQFLFALDEPQLQEKLLKELPQRDHGKSVLFIFDLANYNEQIVQVESLLGGRVCYMNFKGIEFDENKTGIMTISTPNRVFLDSFVKEKILKNGFIDTL